MEFFISSETSIEVSDIVLELNSVAREKVQNICDKSPVKDLKFKIKYVPIIMPPEISHRYPERSKLNAKRKIIDCSPQLDFSIFSRGIWNNIVEHYFQALDVCMGNLSSIGLNRQQIDEVKNVFNLAKLEIIQEGPPPKKPTDLRHQAFLDIIKNPQKPDIGFYREAVSRLEKDLIKCKDPVERKDYLREIKKLKVEALRDYPDKSDIWG